MTEKLKTAAQIYALFREANFSSGSVNPNIHGSDDSEMEGGVDPEKEERLFRAINPYLNSDSGTLFEQVLALCQSNQERQNLFSFFDHYAETFFGIKSGEIDLAATLFAIPLFVTFEGGSTSFPAELPSDTLDSLVRLPKKLGYSDPILRWHCTRAFIEARNCPN